MDTGGNPFNHTSAHRDVLDAPVPADSISRNVLLNEIKGRGRGAVQAQHWYDADLLYKKAIEVSKASSDVKEEAILQSNLSLCQGKMNGWQAAHEAASLATTLDPTYVKGWWRLGQAAAAMEMYDESIQAFNKALECEPKNRAIPKELQKVQQKQKEAKAKASTSTTSTTASKPATTTTAAPKKSSAASSSSSTSASSNKLTSGVEKMQVDDEGFSKSDIVRGYKMVNGKKTSYFHNELDDEAKELIGDIAPKRLEESTAPKPVSSTGPSGSAWNKAGTWEERDVTKWAIDALSEQLKTAKFTYDDKVVTVNKANVDGSASVAMVRGKKKYIYELSAAINYQILVADTDEVLTSGSMKFPDIDGTCMIGEPYDATDFSLDAKSKLSRDDVYPRVFGKGLRDALHQAIDGWVELLKEAY